MAYWNKDWKPGPYPRTAEERAAAAKKYGMRVEDYEPYPDDGRGYGDYPMLPRISAEGRNPYDDFDMPEIRRNYGEPLHVDADAMTEDRWSPDLKKRYSFGQMLAWLGAVWGGLFLLYVVTQPYPYFQPVLPKQYPQKGVKHYTFEPAQ
jgi:NADH dehydrogenase (ubiquinone) 1 beta subcomplex subunit 8